MKNNEFNNDIDIVVMSDTIPEMPAGMEEMLNRPISEDECYEMETSSEIIDDASIKAKIEYISNIDNERSESVSAADATTHALNALADVKAAQDKQQGDSDGDKSLKSFVDIVTRRFGIVDKHEIDALVIVATNRYNDCLDALEVLARVCVLNKAIPAALGEPVNMPPIIKHIYALLASSLEVSQTNADSIGLLRSIANKAQNALIAAVFHAVYNRWDKLTGGDKVREAYNKALEKALKEQKKIMAEATKSGADLNAVKLPELPVPEVFEGLRKKPAVIDDDDAYMKDFFRLWGVSLRQNTKDLSFWDGWKPMDDDTLALTQTWSTALGIPVKNVDQIATKVRALGTENKWNPSLDWLDMLPQWDGHDYISDFCSCVQDKHGLFPAAFRIWVHNLIYKITTGAQAINLMLLGGLKLGKSTLAKYLASALPDRHGRIPAQPKTYEDLMRLFVKGVAKDPDDRVNFFSDKKYRFESDDDMYALKLAAAGNIIMEFPEYELSQKALANSKAFLTSTSNKVRVKYGKFEVELDMGVQFVMTSNPKVFVEVDTHRYLPVIVISIDHSYLSIPAAQIYAQAKYQIEHGYNWKMTDEEDAMFAGVMKEAREESEFSDWITENFFINDFSVSPDCQWFVSDDMLRRALDVEFKGGAKSVSKLTKTTSLEMLGAVQTTGSEYIAALKRTARGWRGITPKPETIKRIFVQSGYETTRDGAGNEIQRPKYTELFSEPAYTDKKYMASGTPVKPKTQESAPAQDAAPATTTPTQETTSADDTIRAEVASQAVSYTMDGPQLPIADTGDEFEPPF